jgi:hypothetical protein
MASRVRFSCVEGSYEADVKEFIQSQNTVAALAGL